MKLNIILEALELRELFNPKLSLEGAEDIISDQVKKRGRFGLDDAQESEVKNLAKGWLNRTIYDLCDRKTEGENVYKLLGSKGLVESLERGRSGAARIFDGNFQDPDIVLTVGGRSNAKVLGEGVVGINLQRMFGFGGNTMEEALLEIEACGAHELVHDYERQKHKDATIYHNDISKDGKSVVFSEGIATFAEPRESKDRNVYIINYRNKLDDLRYFFYKTMGSNDDNRQDVLERFAKYKKSKLLSFNETKRSLDTLESIRSGGRKPTNKEYEKLLEDLFVKAQGPVYRIGFDMFDKISKEYGFGKVKEIANSSNRHDDLFNTYHSLIGNRLQTSLDVFV